MTGTAQDGPSDLPGWASAGFSEQEAAVWSRWRIDLATAVAWQRVGVHDGLRAAQWTIARVTPESVGHWRAAGLDATEAVRCHEMGFDLTAARDFKRRGLTPEQAHSQRIPAGTQSSGPLARLRQLGVPPAVLHTYLMTKWTDDEALPWARLGVPADVALQWRELGLQPPEGARLTQAGQTPAGVVREWWRAGVPYDEVADWLGAGLSAQEAVEQRARGTVVEQAAALRALRRGKAIEPD